MVRPNPRYGDKTSNDPNDVWFTDGGYTRNLFLEKKIELDMMQVTNEVNSYNLSPEWLTRLKSRTVPSWWERVATDLSQDPSDSGSGYGGHVKTHQLALDYLKLLQKYEQARLNQVDYSCKNYPRDTGSCQHATQIKGTLGKVNRLISLIENRITSFQFPDISFPEILPEASAEEEQLLESETKPPTLSSQVLQIINDISNHKIIAPVWFVNNNINWVISGHITEQDFLIAYNHQVDAGNIYPAEPELLSLLSANIKISFNILGIGGFSTSIPIDDIDKLQSLSNSAPEWKYTLIDSSTNPPLTTLNELIITINDLLPNITITDNMVTQQVINFNIINGRAVGSIKFVATNNFNPHYFNKPIVNIIQIKDPNGVKILDVVKQNTLNFTETERDEVINYDEDVKQNTRATIESFVWPGATQPTAFSKMGSWDISETEPAKPLTSGFMAAGVAGAIAGLVLLGFIVDSKVGN